MGTIGIDIGSDDRRPGAAGRGGAPAITPLDAGLQHHAALQGEAVLPQTLPEAGFRGSLVGEPQQAALMGQKAEVPPHVEAEDRHPVGGEVAGRTEHGAITTEHQGQIGRARFGGQQGRKRILGQATGGNDHGDAPGAEILRTAAGLQLGDAAAAANDQPDLLKPHGAKRRRSAHPRLATSAGD